MSIDPESIRAPLAARRRPVSSLLLNVVAPVVLYQALIRAGLANLPALLATSVCPLAAALASRVRARRSDPIAVISLAVIALGAAAAALANRPALYLMRGSLVTGSLGVACLASLVLPRPLMFYAARELLAAGDAERASQFDGLWQYPLFRRSQRTITVVWGLALLVEAAARVWLASMLPVGALLVVSPALGISVTALLLAWSLNFGRRMARRGAELQRQRADQALGQTVVQPQG